MMIATRPGMYNMITMPVFGTRGDELISVIRISDTPSRISPGVVVPQSTEHYPPIGLESQIRCVQARGVG